MDHADVAIVTLAIDIEWPARLRAHSGYLVPKPDQRLVTAVSFGSQKWAHWRGEGEVLRVSIGRDGRRSVTRDDDALVAAAVDEVGRHLGLDLQPTAVRVTRWPRSFPQYRPGHLGWLAGVDAATPPGLFLTGASYQASGCRRASPTPSAPPTACSPTSRQGVGFRSCRHRTSTCGGIPLRRDADQPEKRGCGARPGRRSVRRRHRRPRAGAHPASAPPSSPPASAVAEPLQDCETAGTLPAEQTTTTTPDPPPPPTPRPPPRPPRWCRCLLIPVPPPLDNDPEPQQYFGRLQIPAIDVDSPFLEGIRLSTLDYGPGHWRCTAMPGELGNAAVAGHRTSHNADFRRLDELQPGDEVIFDMDNPDGIPTASVADPDGVDGATCTT